MNKLLEFINRKNWLRLRLLIEGLIVGIGTGVSIGVFRYLLSASEVLRPWIYTEVLAGIERNNWMIPVGYLMFYVVIAQVLTRVIFHEPMCTGSGIPQIKGILDGKMSMNWLSVLLSKIMGGVLAIGAGLSLGREGPSVQIGACVGQGVSSAGKRIRYEEKILLTAGSGAGLAAAFNAPLAGVIFALEELYKIFTPIVLLTAITAAVTATAVTEIFFGGQPVFNMGYLLPLPLNLFGVLIGMGLFVGVLGRCFNRALLFALDAYDRLHITGAWRPFVPLCIAAGLGFVLPEILGGGNRLVDSLVVSDYTLGFLCILFVGKFLFTMVSFGSGVPGGIFLPMLVLGAAGGAIFGKLMTMLGLLPAMYYADIIVFGMAAYFAVVVKSPVTGSVLIMEMTGSFQHMLAMIVVSLVAYLVSDLTGGKPVYDELLNRMLKKSDKQK